MTVLRINKQREIKTPDMERFGFFLKPIIYRREHGFLETRGLLLLDANGVIEKSVAIDCGLTVILNSKTSSLYSINPVAGKYPSATELLQNLKLGRIAQQKTSTIKQVEDEFSRACKASGIDLTALEELTFVGKNSDGQFVYEMLNGRYLVDADGKKLRDVSPAKLLYALDKDSQVDTDALRECISAFIGSDDDFIDNETMSSFTNVVLQSPPESFTLPDSSFTPISFIQSQNINSSQFVELYDMMNLIEAEGIQSASIKPTVDANNKPDEETPLFRFFQSIYKRDFAKTRAYQHDLPAPIIASLGEILFHDGKKRLYSPIVGSIFMLSLFLGKKKNNSDITLNVCEPYHDTKQTLEAFMNKTAGDYQDSDFNMNAFNLKDILEPEPHDICMTFTPSENVHIGVKIPHTNHKTHSRAHQMIIESLDVRSDDGRSIFISPVDDNNKLGSLTESSHELISYLYQQYRSVMIFELDKELLNPSLFKYPVRIYVIGSKTELSQDYEYQQFINYGELSVITKPVDVYLICSNYLNEIENEAASSIDLMSIFDIDEAIEDVEKEQNTSSKEQPSENTQAKDAEKEQNASSEEQSSEDTQNKDTEVEDGHSTDSNSESGDNEDTSASVNNAQNSDNAQEAVSEPVHSDASTSDSADDLRDTERSADDDTGRSINTNEVATDSDAESGASDLSDEEGDEDHDDFDFDYDGVMAEFNGDEPLNFDKLKQHLN